VRFYDKHTNKFSRCKIKFLGYKNLHKVVTNLSELSVWEWYKSGKEMTDFDAPDEWYGWYSDVWKSFDKQMKEIMEQVQTTFDLLKNIENRGEFAKKVMEQIPDYSSVIFALRDGKKEKVREIICNKLRPSDSQSARPVFQAIIPQQPKVTVDQPILFRKITILSGISASGKSTWATDYVHRHNDTVIVSRDSIRAMFWGRNDVVYYNHPRLSEREPEITRVQFSLIQMSLDNGKSVIVDDTNLSLSVINSFLKAFADYDIDFKQFEIPFEDAVQRDAGRARTVGRQVLQEQSERYQILKKSFDFQTKKAIIPDLILQNKTDPKAYVFDLDGTLASNDTGRSFYDWKRVGEDGIRECVSNCAKALSRDYKIIICTGRDACCREQTTEWLSRYAIPYEELHMRPENDCRTDFKVKEDMWRDICSRYNIIALFDDRQQVVDHGRRLGLQVFQVARNDS